MCKEGKIQFCCRRQERALSVGPRMTKGKNRPVLSASLYDLEPSSTSGEPCAKCFKKDTEIDALNKK